MMVIEDIRNSPLTVAPVVLTVGSFDGVHRGHQRILEEVVRAARDAEAAPAVLTLRPHPREFFSPDHAPNLLTTDAKKFELIERAGIEIVFVLEFNAETAKLEPVEFVSEIVCGRCRATELIVGHDFRFGRGAQGDYDLLLKLAGQFGFAVREVAPLLIKGERVSSTVIRERVIQGDLEEAELFLGRKYSILGEVIAGRGLGKTLGFPTANLRPRRSAIPAHGVYAVQVLFEGTLFPAAANIGIAPTIRHEDITVEAHILEFSQDILGREIEIVFHKRLRPEKKFPSRKALAEQIARDVDLVRDYFTRHPEGSCAGGVESRQSPSHVS